MSWKTKEVTFYYEVINEDSTKFYEIARQYSKIGDISVIQEGLGTKFYKIVIKNKNFTRLYHDIQVARICGLSITMKRP